MTQLRGKRRGMRIRLAKGVRDIERVATLCAYSPLYVIYPRTADSRPMSSIRSKGYVCCRTEADENEKARQHALSIAQKFVRYVSFHRNPILRKH